MPIYKILIMFVEPQAQNYHLSYITPQVHTQDAHTEKDGVENF